MERMRRRFERPQKGNPTQLTIHQHVWPVESIRRFADSDGTVAVYDKVRQKTRRAKPTDDLFCAQRVWDQRAESGYMKQIEDAFQAVAAGVASGSVTHIDATQKPAVDSFYALWRARAEWRTEEDGVVVLNAVTGDALSQEQQENLEKKGILFVRRDGMPKRFLHGVRMQFEIDAYRTQISAISWAIIRAQKGQFVVPDYPAHLFIPITPTVCLCRSEASGLVTRENLAEINAVQRTGSREYFFAQDLSKCP